MNYLVTLTDGRVTVVKATSMSIEDGRLHLTGPLGGLVAIFAKGAWACCTPT